MVHHPTAHQPNIDYKELGKVVRRDVVHMLITSGRGHIGSAFSLVEILNVLYEKILKVDGKNPNWKERDRFILSKGHGCLSFYSVLCRKGFFDRKELDLFCREEGILGGHPEATKIPGVEASTGALGHGMSLGLGMALASRIDKIPYKVFVAVGDGECNEGSVWECALSAAKNQADNFIVLVDYNKYQSYGPVSEVLNLEPFTDKWKSFGFDTYENDMDYPEKLEDLLLNKLDYTNKKPKVIICHTIKGKGIPMCENNLHWHHKNKVSDEEAKMLYDALK
jgi:transketolase